MTEQEHRRAQLDEKRPELARKERLEKFANIVSHDLRTPLSVAGGNLGTPGGGL